MIICVRGPYALTSYACTGGVGLRDGEVRFNPSLVAILPTEE